VYRRVSGITGFSISPGVLYELSFKPVHDESLITVDKAVLYRLSFKLSNPIEENGVITLVTNDEFNMDGLDYMQIERGLTDKSIDDRIVMEYDIPTKILTISNIGYYYP